MPPVVVPVVPSLPAALASPSALETQFQLTPEQVHTAGP
jgi:hypothetical protein